MPYGNFDDNYATQLLYNQQQHEDPDLTLSEFVFGKLLMIGDLIDDDDDEIPAKTPISDSQPLQALQIQAGFIESPRPVFKIQETPAKADKPTCLFKDNKFAREYSFSVFHPPAI
ncbi:MAG: hypothetical protein JST09_09055 [Bacteroidetes bacterium]|nr:hypothetical protein [Bacteroidota bacterium]MBS1611014.1 hypothetical protein [Bacteroidota bacterium]